MKHRIFAIWTGQNEMSDNRKRCLESMVDNSACQIELVNPDTINKYIQPEHKLHQCYEYLSLVHKADYLKAYLMNYYGGGISDIKLTKHAWSDAFTVMGDENIWLNGYREIGPHGVAVVHEPLYSLLKSRWYELVGNGAYICKPNTLFTNKWLSQVEYVLDLKLELLKSHPATSPRDHFGMHTQSGDSEYPVHWTEILGNIFHPLCFSCRKHVAYSVPAPDFHGYI